MLRRLPRSETSAARRALPTALGHPGAGAIHIFTGSEPAAIPDVGVLLQHGFGRSCANLRSTARRVASQGFATLCVNADMAYGAPDLATAQARSLLQSSAAGQSAADASFSPWPTAAAAWGPAPSRWVLAGYSAGTAYAAHVARAMLEPSDVGGLRESVAGVALIEPAGGRGFAEALLAVSSGGRRPVWAVLTGPPRCNAQQAALPALRQVQAQAGGRSASVGLQWLGRSMHLDVEGEDTEAVAVWACGEGWPQAAQTETLRNVLDEWLQAMARPGLGSAQTPTAPPWAADGFSASLLRQGLAQPLH